MHEHFIAIAKQLLMYCKGAEEMKTTHFQQFLFFYRGFSSVFRAIFCDENGMTCAMDLDQLSVNFCDLFHPLRIPDNFKV